LELVAWRARHSAQGPSDGESRMILYAMTQNIDEPLSELFWTNFFGSCILGAELCQQMA
jgi:hypothetical protein